MKIHVRLYSEGKLTTLLDVAHKQKVTIPISNPINTITGYILASEDSKLWVLSMFTQNIFTSYIDTIGDSVLSINITPRTYCVDICNIPCKSYIRKSCREIKL